MPLLLPVFAAAAACVDPASHGAVPDDGKSDTAAIQEAIDLAIRTTHRVCLGPGVFELERTRAIGSLTITGGPLELRGAGASTVLRMSGAGRRRDWRAIQIRDASGVVLHDFTVDGLAAHDTEEQTHLLELAPGSRDVLIHDVTFGPMRRPDQLVGQGIGGDCIRLLGAAKNPVVDVTIAHSVFRDCDRSGIAFQRALRRILVEHVTISGTGDSAIDFEPSGRGAIEGVILIDLKITQPLEAPGPVAVSIGGRGTDLARRITLADSTIHGGAIKLMNVADVQLLRNTIEYGARAKPHPTISIIRRARDVVIAKNVISRRAGAVAGVLIRAEHNHDHAPRNLTIEDNRLLQQTAAPVIGMTSVSGVTIRRNAIEYAAGPIDIPIINIAAGRGDVSGVTVVDNTIAGRAAAVLSIKPKQHRIRDVVFDGNTATEIAQPLHCGRGPCQDVERARRPKQ
jgi:hypothetical protein